MINSIDTLKDMYGWLASYKGLPFPATREDYFAFKNKQLKDRFSKKEVKDIYGYPVICPVTIGGLKFGSGEDTENHIWLQPMCVIEGAKRIVKTAIAGGSYSGTVKEFINFDDYRIRIHGFVANRNQRDYPTCQVDLLKTLWKSNSAVRFECEITEDLFDYVVIENLTLDELDMSPGLQRYEISAVSDGVMELEELVIS
jgi:hypothetical protein